MKDSQPGLSITKWLWCKVVGHQKRRINKGRMGREWICERCNKHYRSAPAPGVP